MSLPTNQQITKMIKINQMNGKNMIIKYSQYLYNLKRNMSNTYNILYTSIELYREGRELKLNSNDIIEEDDKLFFIENKEMDYLEELQEGTLDRVKYMKIIFNKTNKGFYAYEPHFFINKFNIPLKVKTTAFGYFFFVRYNTNKDSSILQDPLEKVAYNEHEKIGFTYFKDKYGIPRGRYTTVYSDNYRDYNSNVITYKSITDGILPKSITGLTPIKGKNGRITYKGVNRVMLLKMVKMNGITKGLSKKTTLDLITILLKI